MLENPWSAVENPTSALGLSGSSLGPSSIAHIGMIGIHQLLLSNLTTACMDMCRALNSTLLRYTVDCTDRYSIHGRSVITERICRSSLITHATAAADLLQLSAAPVSFSSSTH